MIIEKMIIMILYSIPVYKGPYINMLRISRRDVSRIILKTRKRSRRGHFVEFSHIHTEIWKQDAYLKTLVLPCTFDKACSFKLALL